MTLPPPKVKQKSKLKHKFKRKSALERRWVTSECIIAVVTDPRVVATAIQLVMSFRKGI